MTGEGSNHPVGGSSLCRVKFVGLIDCNNFFVSCERIFRPDLAGRPVVVTSHGEGCAVAMSEEAKEAGITRGMPIFKARDLIRGTGVVVISGRHRLYGNISARVMSTVESVVPDIEVYSVDEAFMWFPEVDDESVRRIAREIVAKVRRHVGIPASVGVAPTKTLAKVAARFAKRDKSLRGVYVIADDESRRRSLGKVAVGHVWGIGRRLAARLARVGIENALQLADLSREEAERLLNVTGQRTWREINGSPCIEHDPEEGTRKQICTTRTFSPSISELSRLEEAVSSFMDTASRKLRRQRSVAKGISVFVQTNSYRKDLQQYCNSAYRSFEEPTGDLLTLVKHSLDALREIYREGLLYRRAGVIITETLPVEGVQPSLFSSAADREKRRRLNEAVDDMNAEPLIGGKLQVATSRAPGLGGDRHKAGTSF